MKIRNLNLDSERRTLCCCSPPFPAAGGSLRSRTWPLPLCRCISGALKPEEIPRRPGHLSEVQWPLSRKEATSRPESHDGYCKFCQCAGPTDGTHSEHLQLPQARPGRHSRYCGAQSQSSRSVPAIYASHLIVAPLRLLGA